MIELLIDHPWLLLPVAIGGGLTTGWIAAAAIEWLLQAIHRGRIRARVASRACPSACVFGGKPPLGSGVAPASCIGGARIW